MRTALVLASIIVATSVCSFPAHAQCYSPDGERIAFWWFGDNEDIWIINADGGKPARLTHDAAGDNRPEWTPDGEHLTFSSTRRPRANIYQMRPNGTDVQALTESDPDEEYGDAQMSPDGESIVCHVGDGLVFDIWLFDREFNDGVRLTDTASQGKKSASPRFSPDGERIAFVSNRDGSDDIFVMNRDGSDQTNLTKTTEFSEFHPAWSPEGDRLVFVSYLMGGFDLHLIQADGTQRRRVTYSPETYEFSPGWSPDGDWIAFTQYRDTVWDDDSKQDPEASLVVIHPDGTAGRVIAKKPRR